MTGHSKSKRLMFVSCIAASVPLLVSLFFFLWNAKYLEYSWIFGDYISKIRKAYIISGYGFDYTDLQMYQSFVNKGNLSLAALCFILIILLALFVIYLISLKL